MVDGLFIRSLLMAFFFKLYPEIIMDGRLFIAEPPLYRVDDDKDPFVINKEDYVNRYVKAASKDYRIGIAGPNNIVVYYAKDELMDLLSSTSSYADEMRRLSRHYGVNERLMEIIFEECACIDPEIINKIAAGNPFADHRRYWESIDKIINIQHLMNRIGEEFPEMYFDDKDHLIKGVADGMFQLLEVSETLIRMAAPVIRILRRWSPVDTKFVLKHVKTGTETQLSLLGILKILWKYQPKILHRFKGLGENDMDDIKTTIMDPNTRTLIRVQISDIENDMKIFQTLRGNSPIDALNRKNMMRAYQIPRDMIDT